jgi:hypothetical protein
MGLLANVDKSILKVELSHGFKIEVIKGDEGLELISKLEQITPREVLLKLNRLSMRNAEKHIYYISYSSEIRRDSKDWFGEIFFPFDNILYHGYLIPTLKLMRLFKEGSIFMPADYLYDWVDGNPRTLIHGHTQHSHIPLGPVYSLENSELQGLQKFLSETKLPFKEPFLELAVENFEQSYHTQNLNLSFLSLMISLETLFNVADSELRYRISRNCAVLLGKDLKKSKEIFKKIKELYDKRSKIVHTGGSKIERSDLLILRNFVRESIKEISRMKLNKEKLLEFLNLSGFGEGPRVVKTEKS